MLRTKNNIAIEAAIEAVAQAHMRYPGVDPLRIARIAQAIDNVVKGEVTAEVTAALCVELLRTMGARELADLPRLARGGN